MRITYSKHKCQIALFLLTVLSIASFSSIFAKEYTGTVVPISTNEFSWGWNDFYRGKVLYAPMAGDILLGPITNSNGETVRPGDILIKVNSEYRESVYLDAASTAKKQLATYNNAKLQAKRDEKLIKTKAVSQYTFDTDINTSKKAYQALLTDENTADMAKSMLEYILFRTQLDCIINTVYCPFGLLAGENNVLQLSLISPMGVEVKLDASIAENITNQTPVTIYPIRDDKPVGIFNARTRNTEKGIIFEVDNYCLTPDEKNCVPIHNFDYVLNFSPNPAQHKQLAVPVDCLDKDDQGYFVQKAQTPKGEPTDLVKVYVKPANMVRRITPQKEFRALEDAGKLQLHDIVVTKEDAVKAKNSKIALYNRELLFMPGDKVKVVIGQ
jgi:hypothetical protein